MSRDIDSLLAELRGFQGGIADTSTLIYLERLQLLELAAQRFSLWVIPQVVAEYGTMPAGALHLPTVPPGPADAVLCQTAHLLRKPLLSEDRQVLRAARTQNLSYYNTLMIVLALCARGDLAISSFGEVRRELLTFAHYGPQVVAVGDAVFALLRQLPGGQRNAAPVTSPTATPAPDRPRRADSH